MTGQDATNVGHLMNIAWQVATAGDETRAPWKLVV